jgi:methyl-accepting chemotaxis protein
MRWTIKRKLFLGFGLAAILIVALAAIGKWAQVRQRATQEAMARTSGLVFDLEHLVAYIHEVTSEQRSYLISGNEADVAAIATQRADANVTAARIIATFNGDTEQTARMGRYQAAITARRGFVNKLIAARKEQGFEAAKALFDTGEDNRLLAAILVEFNGIKSTAVAQLAAEQAANEELQRTIAWIESIAVLLALVLLIGIALTLTHSIQLNVKTSVYLVGAMAEKDLSQPDGVASGNDELSTAIQAINRMKQAMAHALSEVSDSSAQVAGAGAEIESVSREISDASNEERRHVEQFASSLAEMNAAVKEVAEHAEQASLAANDAVSSASQGQQVVEQTELAMNRITETVQKASTDISALGADTQSTGQVVRIIEDIAGQTNLLALNAAIEAARAGEQGKGFAVVAQEVRVLAERTAKFTKEIADKVEAVQKGADRAVESMQQGENVVQDGVSQFRQVSVALSQIRQRIEASQEGISMIATASTQQSAATAGLTQNMHEISSEVSHITERVDQTAIACAELSRLASGLQRVVDSFQLPALVQKPVAVLHGRAA